jgi:hypothetical protein
MLNDMGTHHVKEVCGKAQEQARILSRREDVEQTAVAQCDKFHAEADPRDPADGGDDKKQELLRAAGDSRPRDAQAEGEDTAEYGCNNRRRLPLRAERDRVDR